MVVDLDDDINSVSTSPAILLSKDDGKADIAKSVDSADVENYDGNSSILKQLLSRMSPAQCLAPETACAGILPQADDEMNFDKVLPTMVRDLQNGGKARSAALLRLYRATDRAMAINRYVRLHQATFSSVCFVTEGHSDT